VYSRPDLTQTTPSARPSVEVADIFRAYGAQYRAKHPVSAQQRKAMRDVEACRTQSLGGHVDVCRCGYQRISYNSCRNRHCPKCQGLKSAKWLAQIHGKILPVPYFHMVFTLPHDLVGIVSQNQQTLYNILFRSAAESLLEFTRDWEGLRAKVGFTAVLHTWTQELLFHPHLHMVVTGGGLNESEDAWIPSRNGFLVPVRALSQKYRGKFIDLIKRAFTGKEIRFHGVIEHLNNPAAFGRLIAKLYRKKWVVYSKRPFGGPEQVFRYLGLYTHKVAISNHRLAEMSGGVVSFYARDNQNPGKKRSVNLPAEEFIRRFLMHILPMGFVKIRHYGLMAHSHAKSKIELARSLIEQAQSSKTDRSSGKSPVPETPNMSGMDILSLQTGINLEICPKCGGNLIRRPLSAPDHPEDFHTLLVFQDSS
jgi:hypothetical protein